MVRRYEVTFQYHFAVALLSFLSAIVTVAVSAWIPAGKISRMTPLEAIRRGEEPPVEKMKRFRLISHLFGVEGELARKSLYARRKSFRTSTISLTLAFLAFSSFLNVEAISAVSTQITYFEKYKDVWDFFITAEDGEKEAEDLLNEIRAVPGIASCTSYQRFTGWTTVTDDMISKEVNAAGGLESFGYLQSGSRPNSHLAEVPLLVLDDESYEQYKNEENRDSDFKDTSDDDASMEVILVNTIWDNLHSRRTDKTFLPYLTENRNLTLEIYRDPALLSSRPETGLPLSVHAYAGQAPKIREEYPAGSLAAITSEEAYRKTGGYFPEGKRYFNIIAEPGADQDEIYKQLEGLLTGHNSAQLESREMKEKSDAPIRKALKAFISAMAFLLALIGLTNVFSGTLGQICQRRKEFARYFSAGLSPEGMKKILLMETLLISLRPVGIGLVLNIPVVLLALHSADIPFSKFIGHMPVLPILAFALFIILTVHLACQLGSRQIINSAIIDTLKDDTMI